MPQYPDDFLYSDSLAAPPASPLIMPEQPGVGLAPPPSQALSQIDLRRQATGRMSGPDKFFTALGEFGAGVTGRESPLDKRIAQQREEKKAKLLEFKVTTDALEDGVKMAAKLRGPARKNFIESYAKQLEETKPGLGDTYRTLSEQPDMGQVLAKYSAKSQTLARSLEFDPSGETALKLLSSPDAIKTINAEIDASVMEETIMPKLRNFVMGWQQIVPPEMVERFQRDKRISSSELREASDWINENKPEFKGIVISPEQWVIINRNQDASYGVLGILGPKDEADILKERAKDKPPTTRTIQRGSEEVQQEWREGKWHDVGKGPKFKDESGRLTPITMSVDGKNRALLVDREGNYFDVNTKRPVTGNIEPQISSVDQKAAQERATSQQRLAGITSFVDKLEKIVDENPRSAAGILSVPIRGIEWVSNSMFPGLVEEPGKSSIQLRDALMSELQNFSRISNQERERIENAFGIGGGSTPDRAKEGISIMRTIIARERAALGVEPGRSRPGATDDMRKYFKKP